MENIQSTLYQNETFDASYSPPVLYPTSTGIRSLFYSWLTAVKTRRTLNIPLNYHHFPIKNIVNIAGSLENSILNRFALKKKKNCDPYPLNWVAQNLG